jgi:hypothetical protein
LLLLLIQKVSPLLLVLEAVGTFNGVFPTAVVVVVVAVCAINADMDHPLASAEDNSSEVCST